MSEPKRRFPNREDRMRLEKVSGHKGTTAFLAEEACVDPKYVAIELKAMTFRGEADKIPIDERGHYIWRLR